jgi:cyclic pyranopterin phosphate synthase
VTPLADAQGRRITYLRLSLTDRCNFRCSYCASGEPDRTRRRLLDRGEIRRLAAILAGLGVRRIRLTGGEPTLRGDLPAVVEDLANVPGIEEVVLTTNGQLLAGMARRLRASGVARLNVSLDTLDPERFRRLGGPGADLPRVLDGIEAAAAAGFASLKLNTVVLAGENEGELGELARFAWRHGAIARFIELMPFGEVDRRPVPVPEMERLLGAQGVALAPDATRGWGPARHMRGTSREGGRIVEGLLGFIGALSEGFCDGCNRIRVGADGSLRACLGGREAVPLGDLLRSGAGDDAVADAIRAAVGRKADRHAMRDGRLPSMLGIGG